MNDGVCAIMILRHILTFLELITFLKKFIEIRIIEKNIVQVFMQLQAYDSIKWEFIDLLISRLIDLLILRFIDFILNNKRLIDYTNMLSLNSFKNKKNDKVILEYFQ